MEKLKKFVFGKKPWALFALGAAGLMMISLAGLIPSESEETVREEADPCIAIEERLAQTIEKIDGAGKTHVMVSISDNGKKNYLTEKSEDETLEDGTVKSRSSSSRSVSSSGGAVIVSEEAPHVSGVAVVCGGGNDPDVQSAVYELIYALYGLSSARVSIEKMQ